MSKYKNTVGVFGDILLLEAFEKKAQALGFKSTTKCNNTDTILKFYPEYKPVYNWLNNSTFLTFDQFDTLKYNLPQDWDKALAAIQEKEEIPEYVTVTKSSNSFYWYENHIGKVFKVEGRKDVHYIVNNHSNTLILIDDCISATKKEFDEQNEVKFGDFVFVTKAIYGAFAANGRFGKVLDKYKDSEVRGFNKGLRILMVDNNSIWGLGEGTEVEILSEEKILELFTAEATKRRLVAGVKYTSFAHNKEVRTIKGDNWGFVKDWNDKRSSFSDDAYILWNDKDGWVSPIKEIKIGEYNVEFKKNTASKLNWITVGGYDFSENILISAKHLFTHSKIQSINAGCNGQFKITLDQVDEILDLLNELK